MSSFQDLGDWGSLSTAKIYLVKDEPFNEEGHLIAKLNINSSVVNTIEEVVDNFKNQLIDKEFIPITDIDGQDEDFLLTVPLTDVPSFQEIINCIIQERFVVPNVHSDICLDYLKGMKFYIIEATYGEKHFFFVRRYSANNLITPRKYMFVCEDNTFTRLDNTNVISLDNKIDAFIVDGIIYIANDKAFSLVSGYYERERIAAGNMLDGISRHSVIAGFEELKEHCENRISLIKKLSKIDPINLQKITYEKVHELKNQRGIDFLVDEERRQVTFSNTTQMKNIIDLILDNFVRSDVTDTCYRAVNKMKEQAS